MRNLPLLDIPYNLFKLEVFDILLSVALPSPFLAFGIVVHPVFLLPYPFLVAGIALKIRDMKKDKAFGYMQRKFYVLGDEIRAKVFKKNVIMYP